MEEGKGEKARERCIYVSLGREHVLFIRVLREALPASKCLYLLPFLPPSLTILSSYPVTLPFSSLLLSTHNFIPHSLSSLSLTHYW